MRSQPAASNGIATNPGSHSTGPAIGFPVRSKNRNGLLEVGGKSMATISVQHVRCPCVTQRVFVFGHQQEAAKCLSYLWISPFHFGQDFLKEHLIKRIA